MNKFNRYFIIVSLLSLALLFYFIGFDTGALIFFVLGGLFELGFWIGVFTTKTKLNSSEL